MDGKMLWFNEDEGFGFISGADGERISVDRSAFVAGDVPVGRCAGVPVRLSVTDGADGKLVAVDVSLVHESDPARARLRGHGRLR